MRRLQQSTSRVVMLKVFLTSDHITAATGKTVAITISKNGAAFANPNAGATNATEVSSGWYKVTLDTTDTNTVGDLVVRGTAAACDDSEQVLNVESSVAQTGDSYAILNSAHAEPTGVPAADATLPNKIGFMFMAFRNRVDVTATKKQFYDDGGAVEFEKDLSDNGTTYTETEANAP